MMHPYCEDTIVESGATIQIVKHHPADPYLSDRYEVQWASGATFRSPLIFKTLTGAQRKARQWER